jgi:hypothetical protein
MKYLNNVVNLVYYHWRRSNWIFGPRFHLSDFRKIVIEKPIFLIGNQGGGLTLVSRILRRNPNVISVTGNYKYWSGADEMQNVFELNLPFELAGLKIKAPHHPVLTLPRSWTYATDTLLPYYRKTEKDANKSASKVLEKIIRYSLAKFSVCNDKKGRFIDKSQVFTVKVSFINELLKQYKPKFVLITRSPYVSCYRAATGKAVDMERLKRKRVNFRKRLILCTQHWTNSMKCALEDKEKENIDMAIFRFEDILRKPKKNIKKLCDFAELDFEKDMLPTAEHKIPLGTRFKDRWYPLKSDINKEYLEKVEKESLKIIEKKCGDIARNFGYTPEL